MKEEDQFDGAYMGRTMDWANARIRDIKEHPLRSGLVLLLFSTLLLAIALIEVLYYSLNQHGPFLTWRAGCEAFNVAQWNMIVYVVILLMFSGAFFYYGIRLAFSGIHQR